MAGVVARGRELYRDLPWRNTRDPYAVLLSEVMLQQTQVPRVVPKYEAWLEEFPTLDALAAAPLEPVLRAWQGLGYNRRAIALKRTAEEVVERFGGQLPSDEAALRSLPGIGPATASGVRAFAFELPGVYLETNVRAVFLHELFADRDGVTDRELTPLVAARSKRPRARASRREPGTTRCSTTARSSSASCPTRRGAARTTRSSRASRAAGARSARGSCAR